MRPKLYILRHKSHTPISAIIPAAASETESDPNFGFECKAESSAQQLGAQSEADRQVQGDRQPGSQSEADRQVQSESAFEAAYDESQLVALEMIIDKIGGILDIDTTQTGITVRVLI